MKIPNDSLDGHGKYISLARIVSEDSQHLDDDTINALKSSKDS